jgi:hypothetical protein
MKKIEEVRYHVKIPASLGQLYTLRLQTKSTKKLARRTPNEVPRITASTKKGRN